MPESDTSPSKEPDKTQPTPQSPNLNEPEIARAPQEEIVWLRPETDEEWVLFRRLLDDIEMMYDFALDRGIEPPLAAIEGIPKLLAFSKPEASEILRPPKPADQPTTSELKPTK